MRYVIEGLHLGIERLLTDAKGSRPWMVSATAEIPVLNLP
jgi:hypothetical protein